MKKKYGDLCIVIIGITLFVIGFYLVNTSVNPQGILETLPFVLIGIGSGSFGHGIGNIIRQRAIQDTADIQKKLEIDMKDERNISIRNHAKAKAYDMMVFVFGALMLTFILMKVDMTIILLSVFAYLIVVGCSIYYRYKFEKNM